MKNIILTIVSLSIIFSCKQNIVETNNKKSTNSTSILVNEIEKPYKSAPPMVIAENGLEYSSTLLANNEIIKKIKDPKLDWNYFHNEYKTIKNPSTYEKQFYGYIILSLKDLISDNNNDEIKKFYINELVNSSYKGYCTLYYALQSLQKNEPNQKYIESVKEKIINDYNNDKSIKGFLTLDIANIKDTKQQKQMQNVKNNYGYINSLKTL